MPSSVRHSARPTSAEDEPPNPRSSDPADPGGNDPGTPSHEDPGSDTPSDGEPELQVRKLSPTGLVASGAAAATATVVGGQLGFAGTVIGAALTSVVSATALALYTDSVNRSASKLKAVATKGNRRPAAAGAPTAFSSRTGPRTPVQALQDDGIMPEAPSRWRRIIKIALLAAAIALIGITAVFGIQRVTGTELSPGTGQFQRAVTGTDAVAPRDGSSSTDEDPQDQQDGVDPDQQDGEAPAPDLPGDPGEGSDPQQDDGAPQDQNDAPADQPSAPAQPGTDPGSGDGGDSGTSGE